MKASVHFFTSVLCLFCLANAAFAQKAEVKDIDVNGGDSTTTISVQKGKKASSRKHYKIEESTGEVVGEANVLMKEARNEWKKACDNWKKEVRDLNKGNVLSLTCNSPTCSSDPSGTVCKSVGTFKVKVETDEESED